MGHSKIVVALLCVFVGAGCASLRWSVQKSFRNEGRANEALPEEVWNEYQCGAKKLPFFEIEKNELIPPRVRPGGEFNHRMVYAMCPAQTTAVVAGRLHTRIRYRGEPLYGETEVDYELLPGRWRVDSFVEIPDAAQPGIYSYELEFTSRSLKFSKHASFLVPNP